MGGTTLEAEGGQLQLTNNFAIFLKCVKLCLPIFWFLCLLQSSNVILRVTF